MKNLQHLVGKRVRVTCEISKDVECGILSSDTVDWECDKYGQTVYILNGNYLTDGDIVEAAPLEKDSLDLLGDLMEDMFKELNNEITALNWRLTKPAYNQTESRFLRHRIEMLENIYKKFRQRLYNIGK